jgi:hypothetical protein
MEGGSLSSPGMGIGPGGYFFMRGGSAVFADAIHVTSDLRGPGFAQFSGGSVSVGSISAASSEKDAFHHVSITGSVSITTSAIHIDPHSDLRLNGGTIHTGTIYQNGTLVVGGITPTTSRIAGMDLGRDSRSTINATLSVSGVITNPYGAPIEGTGTIQILSAARFRGLGIVDPTVVNSGTLTASTGNLILRGPVTNAGTLEVEPFAGLFITQPLSNTGDIRIGASGALSVSSALSVNPGRSVVISGGLLSATNFTNFGSFSGFGQISGGVVNFGSMTFVGPSQIIGNLTNTTNGRIMVRNDRVLVTGMGTNNGSITVANGTIIFDGGLGLAATAGSVTLGSDGAVLASYVRQNAVVLDGGPGTPAIITSRRRAFGGDTSVIRALTIMGPVAAPNGRWDLGDAALIIDHDGASPFATVRDYIVAGYAGGAWSGTGLTSSAAASAPGRGLGYAEAGALFNTFPTTFAGQPIDNTSVLVAYARYGDANLDGTVNLQDFNRLAASFGQSNRFWQHGDFNYDGTINLQDFNRLAGNFGLSAAGPGVTPQDWANLAAAVPEPALGAAVVAFLTVIRPRRRRATLPI